MSKNVFPVVTEKKALKVANANKFCVFVHVKSTCPVCDRFLPNVMEPISKMEKYKDIKFYQINEPLTFPVGSHPVTYFFREGRCVQHPAGQAPKETVESLLDTIFLGKAASSRYSPSTLEINTEDTEFNQYEDA